MEAGPLLIEDGAEPIGAFVDRLKRCITRRPDGPAEIDFDCVAAVVLADAAAAREYVELACREALTSPGFLAPAALIARAYRHATGDGTLVDRVTACERAVREVGEPEHPLRSPRADAKSEG